MRHSFLFPALLLLLGASEGSPAHVHSPAVPFELAADSVVIPMRQVDGRIHVDLMLDGKGPFPFIFDTGAQGSVMDLAFAREQGLELGQEVNVGSPNGRGRPGNLVTLKTVTMGGLTMRDMTSVAFEGMPFKPAPDAPRGVLGPYGLKGLLVTLDYPGQRLVFRRGALPEPDGQEVFGWGGPQGLPVIPARLAGEAVEVHLDSGSSGSLSLPNDFAERLPLGGPLVDKGYAKTVDEVRPVRGAPLKGAFTIGRYTLENPTVNFVDIAKKTGNVGAAILSQFALTIDPVNNRLRLSGPADGRLQVKEERKPRYGMQLASLEPTPLEVRVVDAGSPAEKAGLKAGDRIVALNGRSIEDLKLDDRLAALKDSTLQVTVRRGKENLDLKMDLASAP